MKYNVSAKDFRVFLGYQPAGYSVGLTNDGYNCPIANYIKTVRRNLPEKVNIWTLKPLWAKVFVFAVDNLIIPRGNYVMLPHQCFIALDVAMFASRNLSRLRAFMLAYEKLLCLGKYECSVYISREFNDLLWAHYGRIPIYPSVSDELYEEAEVIVKSLFDSAWG
jgi:hypothetical protein